MRRGLTPVERAIMALWDDGRSTRQVARTLQIDHERVQRTVIHYDGAADARLHRAAMAAGSADLAGAIARARGA